MKEIAIKKRFLLNIFFSYEPTYRNTLSYYPFPT